MFLSEKIGANAILFISSHTKKKRLSISSAGNNSSEVLDTTETHYAMTPVGSPCFWHCIWYKKSPFFKNLLYYNLCKMAKNGSFRQFLKPCYYFSRILDGFSIRSMQGTTLRWLYTILPNFTLAKRPKSGYFFLCLHLAAFPCGIFACDVHRHA